MARERQQPAFPTDDSNDTDGMSLRDWFAGQAVIGHLSAHAGEYVSVPSPSAVANYAYECADAMMKRREQ